MERIYLVEYTKSGEIINKETVYRLSTREEKQAYFTYLKNEMEEEGTMYYGVKNISDALKLLDAEFIQDLKR